MFKVIKALVRSFLIILFPILFSISSQAQVWTETSSWSPEWEVQFTNWVQQNWQVDFFSRKTMPNGQRNPYYGIRMDCADTVYSMRIVFSYEHKLPFVVQDPTTTGKTLSNRMTRWNRESNEIQRVHNFLEFMYDTLSTISLPNDTFPVPVSREWIHSGSLIKTTPKNHHSWSVKEVLAIGVPHLIFNSTISSKSGYGLQERISWPNPKWVFESDFTPAGTAGFRYWRPESALNKPVWETPNYSEEQYRIPLDKWNKVVQAKLAINSESDDQLIHRLSETVCVGLQARITSVNEGLDFIRNNRSCMDYATYDIYSTPSRDHRVFDDLTALRRAYKDLVQTNGAQNVAAPLREQLDKVFPYLDRTSIQETAKMAASAVDGRSTCLVEYAPGKQIDMAEAKRRIYAGLISNNPLDEVEYRWGERAGPSSRAKSCQSWDVWTPDLKQAD